MSHIADVIKYEGDNQTFIWKHPVEDFNTGSQLIVHESQEALFFMNGQALDLFGPGRHMLETQNLPMTGRLLKASTDGKTPFHCEVYFINKTEQMAIKWGTDSKLEYVEPSYGFPIKLGASGEMALRAEDSRRLLVKLVGTEKGMTQQGIIAKFRGILMLRFKAYLAQFIKENQVNIFEIDQHLERISSTLHEKLMPDFADYGVALERFFITTVVKPEDDRTYQKFRELHFRQYADIAEAKLRQQVGVIDQQTQAQRMKIEAEAIATKRALEGYTYQQERGFDVAEVVARNEAVGQFTNLGVGLGTMAGVGGAVSGLVGGMMNGAVQSATNSAPLQGSAACPKCGTELPPNAMFCFNCGEKIESIAENETICPNCGEKTPKGKFCMNCGSPLAQKCPNCNADIPAGGKFCLECGQKL